MKAAASGEPMKEPPFVPTRGTSPARLNEVGIMQQPDMDPCGLEARSARMAEARKDHHRHKSGYSEERAAAFLERVATEDLAIGLICLDPDMPGKGTVFNWRQAYPHFSEAYDKALEARAHAMVDGCMDIADRAPPLAAHVAKATLQTNVRWRIAASLLAKVYGLARKDEEDDKAGGKHPSLLRRLEEAERRAKAGDKVVAMPKKGAK